ncbi:hypothetical protein [Xenorhabdus thailandensis]|uniref:hypothetical protein n=1 Tax=Xenorhabdus thailandensis TaxID=3136255 RepID=UPI0030F4AD9A
MQISNVNTNFSVGENTLLIPDEIKIRIENISQCYDLRSNNELLNLNAKVREIIDPYNLISDSIRKKVIDNGYVVISGFPIDIDKPDTPIVKMKKKPSGKFITEKILIYLSSLFGRPYAYQAENNGEFIHKFIPLKVMRL